MSRQRKIYQSSTSAALSPTGAEPVIFKSPIATNVYRTLLLGPSEPGAPHVDAHKVTEFLEEWSCFCDNYGYKDPLKGNYWSSLSEQDTATTDPMTCLRT